jgi:hypothetical protein
VGVDAAVGGARAELRTPTVVAPFRFSQVALGTSMLREGAFAAAACAPTSARGSRSCS